MKNPLATWKPAKKPFVYFSRHIWKEAFLRDAAFSSDSYDLYDFHLSFVSFLLPMFPPSIRLFPFRFIPLYFSSYFPSLRPSTPRFLHASINETTCHVAEKVTTLNTSWNLQSDIISIWFLPLIIKCFYFGATLKHSQLIVGIASVHSDVSSFHWVRPAGLCSQLFLV